jgi:outer membrane protein OmpA-like peptidoglycan-associated protein
VLLPESSAELDQLVAALKKNPHWTIEIVGYTDNVGDSRLNLALSENRAKVVSSYLTRRGIADERVTSKGYGSTRPIADNTIERERSKNRRVEITIR